MRFIRIIAASGTALGGASYLLVRFAPAPTELARRLQAPHGWVAQVGTDAAAATVAGALLWLCALWVAIGLTAVWIGQLPGLAGRLGRAVTRCMVPVAIQRLVATAAGFSLLLGGASAGAVGQSGGSPAVAGSATGMVAAPGWPLDQRAPTHSPETPSQPTETPSQPAEMPRQPAEQPPSSQRTPSQPTGSPTPDRSTAGSAGWPLDSGSGTPSAGPAPRSAAPAGSTTTAPTGSGHPTAPGKTAAPIRAGNPGPAVTVRPGDSLWTIASAELGPAATDPQIAIAWPYWYRANRQLIGRDPNLLRPGTRLNRPVADPPGERPGGLPSNERQPIREGLRP
jgi:nucleoid-associated protein YgaU